MLYWDTSAILPLYVEETDSLFWDKILAKTDDQLCGSQLNLSELVFAVQQKVIRRTISHEGAKIAFERFQADAKDGHWQLYPIGADVIEECSRIAESCYQRKNPIGLRTLDGLHLATANLLHCDTVATNDQRMATAADALGLKVVQPGDFPNSP